MPAIDVDAERAYDGEQFTAQEATRTDRSKVVCAYFEPGQFIPVHAPASDVVVSVRATSYSSRPGRHAGPGPTRTRGSKRCS